MTVDETLQSAIDVSARILELYKTHLNSGLVMYPSQKKKNDIISLAGRAMFSAMETVEHLQALKDEMGAQ